jgi:tyrosine-protein phosphatase YwqE
VARIGLFWGFNKVVEEMKMTFGLWGQECRMHFQIVKTIKRKRLNEEVTSEFMLENFRWYKKKRNTQQLLEHYSNEF